MAPKMVKSGKERTKDWVENMKTKGTYRDYLMKKKECMAERRKATKNGLEQMDDDAKQDLISVIREKERLRKANYLKNKKAAAAGLDSPSGYKCSASKGRAVAKAKRDLPVSPRKRGEVVKSIAFEQIKVKPFTSDKRRWKQQNEIENEKLVLEFYQRDDISQQEPGKNDVVVTRSPSGSKVKKQKRHLQMSVMEAYFIWKSENPTIKMGKSKFAQICPPFVQLTSQLPRNVCVCQYHANFILLLDALHRYDQVIPKYSEDFTSIVVCDQPGEDCWKNVCAHCKDAQRFKAVHPFIERNLSSNDESGDSSDGSDEENEATVKWWQWESLQDVDGRETLEKVSKRGLPVELYECVVLMLPSFLLHHYIKRCQSKAYNELREKRVQCDDSLAMLQIDFAENYSTIWQDEIQSAHWKKKQVTLLTSVYWSGYKTTSSVVVSDDLTHTKNSVITFVDTLLSKLLSSKVKLLHIWSDGPSSQFKNKFVAASLPWLAKRHSIDIQWHYFATSHGKGC